MRIGIDACCWSNRRGFGRFTRNLIEALITEHPEHRYQLVVDRHTAQDNQFPRGAEVHTVATSRQPTVAAAADGARGVLDIGRLSWAASRLGPDVFFFPAVYSYFPIARRIPIAVTFHDAIAEEYSEKVFRGWRSRLFWQCKTWLARRQATRIVTVSEAARTQIRNSFGTAEDAISVISEGVDATFRPMADQRAQSELRQRFAVPAAAPLMVYVGGISPHKNLDGLLQAASRLAQRAREPWHLVLAGDYRHDSFLRCYDELVHLAAHLGLAQRVTFTGFVSNQDLVTLYNAAALVVLPSLSEGFGLPVVEAMACGVPVACSRRGSLPEIVGDAGLLFDPLNFDNMAECLQRLLIDQELHARLRAAGLLRVKEFTWSAAASRLVTLLESMANAR
jgi:glycosyltransferase involved in cell wall biosynthesis